MKKLIKNVNVFNGKDLKLFANKNIVIEDELVTEIFEGDCSEEGFDEVIDGKQLTAMPGMVESHTHLGAGFPNKESIGLDYDIALSVVASEKVLMNGFTTVRDAGGVVQGLKKAFDKGVCAGPRIFPSNAFISQTCGHGDMYDHWVREIQYKVPTFSVLADGVAEVQRATREQFYKGASQIKIMAGGGCISDHDPLLTVQFSFEEIKAVVDCAKDYGTYVMAHLYTPETMMRCGKAGVKSFEHAHIMDEETARMIISEGIFVDPMPQFGMIPENVANAKTARGEKVKMVRNGETVATELINKYNIKILFGTDMMINSDEFVPCQSSNLSRYKTRFGSGKTLLATTGNAYDMFKLSTYQNPYPEGKIGVLEEGSFADILLVAGNPVDDVSVLSDVDNIKMIMKNSKVYKNTID